MKFQADLKEFEGHSALFLQTPQVQTLREVCVWVNH